MGLFERIIAKVDERQRNAAYAEWQHQQAVYRQAKELLTQDPRTAAIEACAHQLAEEGNKGHYGKYMQAMLLRQTELGDAYQIKVNGVAIGPVQSGDTPPVLVERAVAQGAGVQYFLLETSSIPVLRRKIRRVNSMGIHHSPIRRQLEDLHTPTPVGKATLFVAERNGVIEPTLLGTQVFNQEPQFFAVPDTKDRLQRAIDGKSLIDDLSSRANTFIKNLRYIIRNA
jgi:hypothetical protein